MTTQVVAVRRGATFKEMAAMLRRFRVIKRLPVVNAGGCLVGVLSRTDVLAVRDRLSYPDAYPIVAGPVLLQETL
jgi:CBS domain-containing protein